MEPIKGIHLGLVVSSSPDPEGRNRVQVWVPHLSNTLYGPLNQKLKDVKFKGPEDLNNIDKDILITLQTTLPWAEYGAPLFGGSSGAFNTATGQTAVNSGSTLQTNNNTTPALPTTTLNMSNSGTKPQMPDSLSAAAKSIGSYAASSIGSSYHEGVPMQCANWVNSVLKNSGVTTSGSDSAASFANMGTRISNINQVEPGDVVILRSNVSNSGYHAGVATIDPNSGALTFASKRGANLPITSDGFNSGYVQNGFAYAVRLDGSQSTNGAQNIANQNSANGAKGVVYNDRSAGVGIVPSNVGVPGSPVGTFSTPNGGTKVWVFFMGGDAQRPVYFAQSPNPGDINALRG